ncbi:MAG: hypothetical protein VYC39_17965 [Myxococcota bacterium]|nr:hypothetical protein [Myxococcota bacterium]
MLTNPAAVIFLVCTLLADDGAETLRTAEEAALVAAEVEFASNQPGDPRFMRFEMLKRALNRDWSGAKRMAEALSEQKGWENFGSRRVRRWERRRNEDSFEFQGFWGVLLALVFGVLILASGRNLLRPSQQAISLLASGIVVVGLGYLFCPKYVILLGFDLIVVATLTHTAFASVQSRRPSPRGRLLFATLYFLGLSAFIGLLFTRVHPI